MPEKTPLPHLEYYPKGGNIYYEKREVMLVRSPLKGMMVALLSLDPPRVLPSAELIKRLTDYKVKSLDDVNIKALPVYFGSIGRGIVSINPEHDTVSLEAEVTILGEPRKLIESAGDAYVISSDSQPNMPRTERGRMLRQLYLNMERMLSEDEARGYERTWRFQEKDWDKM